MGGSEVVRTKPADLKSDKILGVKNIDLKFLHSFFREYSEDLLLSVANGCTFSVFDLTFVLIPAEFLQLTWQMMASPLLESYGWGGKIDQWNIQFSRVTSIEWCEGALEQNEDFEI